MRITVQGKGWPDADEEGLDALTRYREILTLCKHSLIDDDYAGFDMRARADASPYIHIYFHIYWY